MKLILFSSFLLFSISINSQTNWLWAKEAQELKDGLAIRNELSHDYDGEKFDKAEKQLRTETFPALEKLYYFFTKQLSNQ